MISRISYKHDSYRLHGIRPRKKYMKQTYPSDIYQIIADLG
ncbi:hypothetical protein SAMN05444380_11172 [Thermophagus xiamenensis]|uniref:Uncharacterized protein n=1 Tax=Thermophagus xiamenensis TaxID=385682 RepID=A0A1I2AIS7_9BACT|nr:hypothetical protein SAMN05444380_11172 [Thermophagus xiamenensis]